MNMKVCIGSDHAGFSLKEKVISFLRLKGVEVIEEGAFNGERSDYPDFAHKVAGEVLKNGLQGILMCGSGNGIGIAANRHKGIRAAIAWKPELAEMARKHNDANILVLPARYIEE